MPAMYSYRVRQTREIMVNAADPGAAADAARYIFRGERPPVDSIEFVPIMPKIKVIRLEVDEA